MSLSQVDDFCLWEILGIETELTVGDTLLLEFCDVEDGPFLVAQQLDLCRLVSSLADGDK